MLEVAVQRLTKEKKKGLNLQKMALIDLLQQERLTEIQKEKKESHGLRMQLLACKQSNN